MEKNMYSRPLSLRSMKINDKFWKQEMEVVRKEVIPYQWAALNDQVEGAAPSFCMRNFKVAGKQNKERKEQGKAFIEPKYTFRGFESLPEDPNHYRRIQIIRKISFMVLYSRIQIFPNGSKQSVIL